MQIARSPSTARVQIWPSRGVSGWGGRSGRTHAQSPGQNTPHSGKKVPLCLVWRGSSLCGEVLDIMVILIFKTIVMADFYIVLIVYPEPF